MSYVILPHVATGDLATAALHNTLLDNLAIIKTNISDLGELSGLIRTFYEYAANVSLSGTTLAVNLAGGPSSPGQNVVPFTLSADVTPTTISNIPVACNFCSILWIVKANGTPHTWAWLTATVVWDGAVAPTLVSTINHIMAFQTWTIDAGTTWRGVNVAGNYAS